MAINMNKCNFFLLLTRTLSCVVILSMEKMITFKVKITLFMTKQFVFSLFYVEKAIVSIVLPEQNLFGIHLNKVRPVFFRVKALLT